MAKISINYIFLLNFKINYYLYLYISSENENDK
jgi:hypothetical protein